MYNIDNIKKGTKMRNPEIYIKVNEKIIIDIIIGNSFLFFWPYNNKNNAKIIKNGVRWGSHILRDDSTKLYDIAVKKEANKPVFDPEIIFPNRNITGIEIIPIMAKTEVTPSSD